MVLIHPGAQAIAHFSVEPYPEGKEHADRILLQGVFFIKPDHLPGNALLLVKRMYAQGHEANGLLHGSVDVHFEVHQLHSGYKLAFPEASVEIHLLIQFHVAGVFCFVFPVAVLVQIFECGICVEVYIHVFVHYLRSDQSDFVHWSSPSGHIYILYYIRGQKETSRGICRRRFPAISQLLIKAFELNVGIHLSCKFLDAFSIIGVHDIRTDLDVPPDIYHHVGSFFLVIKAQGVYVLPLPDVLMDETEDSQSRGDAIFIDNLFFFKEAGSEDDERQGYVYPFMPHYLEGYEYNGHYCIEYPGRPVSVLDDPSEFFHYLFLI